MPRKKGAAAPLWEKANAQASTETAPEQRPVRPGECLTCHNFMPASFFGRQPTDDDHPVHCYGSACAWQSKHGREPHHGRTSYQACWKCHGDMGCEKCSGSVQDVLCTKCAAWGTPEALANHGPVTNDPGQLQKRHGKRAPTFEEYPEHFKAMARDRNSLEPELPRGRYRPQIKSVPQPEPCDYDGEGIFEPVWDEQ